MAQKDFTEKTHSVSEQRVVGYGAGRKSNSTYAALLVGTMIAVGAILFMIGWSGNRTYTQANNPSVKIDGQSATVPGAGTTGQASPGGNWDTRLNSQGTQK